MSIENFVDQALLLSRKKEHDQLEVLFIKHMEVLLKNPRSWGSILDLARGEPVANTMILAVVGGFPRRKMIRRPRIKWSLSLSSSFIRVTSNSSGVVKSFRASSAPSFTSTSR